MAADDFVMKGATEYVKHALVLDLSSMELPIKQPRDQGEHPQVCKKYFTATMGFLSDSDHAHGMMHAGITKPQFPLKSVAGKTFLALPDHAQLPIFPIW